ncbi:MAG TPA: hypothetical protein DCZ94_04200 [Lentisphaeria bacterium]|nr:MAG: hypothetical protein A2X48_05420 [Lentisphaerae bacterium GWF2_49_21]HBC86138.1 hypothetical protein [Lentisphaeria bacterium]
MPIQYRKICKGGDFLRSSRIYMAEDHLLYVLSNGYTEEYRRFFFKDIQYIVLCQTRSWWVYTGIWGFIGAGILAMMFFAASEFGEMTASVIAVLGFLPLMVNFLLGTSARAVIKTITSEEKISLTPRYRSSLKVLAEIKAKIEVVQGRIDKSSLIPGAGQTG